MSHLGSISSVLITVVAYVLKHLFESSDELFTSELEVFDGLNMDRVGAGMATELRIQVSLINEVVEESLDGSSVAVACIIKRVVGGDRGAKREVVQVASITVVVEMRVVATDSLVVQAAVFVELIES